MKLKKISQEHYIIIDDANVVMYLISTLEAKELFGVVDVEKKAQIEWGNVHRTGVLGYIDGYNQALEDNKEKKWTDEDVIKIVEKSRQTGLTAEYIILSLKPQTEWEVEFVNGKLQLVKE